MTEQEADLSAENAQKSSSESDYVHIEDAATDAYANQPLRKTGETTLKGIIVGKGDRKTIIPIEQVRKLASLHLTYRDMADFFGVKESTFRDHFRFEVERYRQVTKQRLMEAMLSNAIDKMNPTMQVWLSKNLLGFADSPINTENSTVLPWSTTE
jgi:hypothetical protein